MERVRSASVKHRAAVSLACLAVFLAIVMLTRCAEKLPPEGPSEEEILKAMHDDLSVSHKVADFMIKDDDGIDLLAERLSKDPRAAAQLFETIARKGGGQKAIAVACLRVAEWERQQTVPPVPPNTSSGAQELQRQPSGGK